MKNRRDFLKTLLGVVLVAPVACRTVEPIVLPAELSEAETMLAASQGLWNSRGVHDSSIERPLSDIIPGERVEYYSDGTMAYFIGDSKNAKWREKVT